MNDKELEIYFPESYGVKGNDESLTITSEF